MVLASLAETSKWGVGVLSVCILHTYPGSLGLMWCLSCKTMFWASSVYLWNRRHVGSTRQMTLSWQCNSVLSRPGVVEGYSLAKISNNQNYSQEKEAKISWMLSNTPFCPTQEHEKVSPSAPRREIACSLFQKNLGTLWLKSQSSLPMGYFYLGFLI